MWGDVQPGRSFRGILNYVFNGYKKDPKRPEDVRLIGGNMVGRDARDLAKEFRYSRALRPDIKVAMSHIPLSLADGEYFDDKTWNDVAERHLEFLGYTDVQWTMIRHSDTEHDHVHIIASSIRWDGSKVNSSMNWEKGAKSRQLIEKDYGLVRSAMTPSEARKAKRREPAHPPKAGATPEEEEATRRHLRQILKETTKTTPTISALIEQLEKQGVMVRPNIAKTGRVSGISYELDGHTFKGSKLGKPYAWQGLQRLSRVEFDEDRDLEPLKLASQRGLSSPNETSIAEKPTDLPKSANKTEPQPSKEIAESKRQEQPKPTNKEKDTGNKDADSQLPEPNPKSFVIGGESSTNPAWEGEPQVPAENSEIMLKAIGQNLAELKPTEPIEKTATPHPQIKRPEATKAQVYKSLEHQTESGAAPGQGQEQLETRLCKILDNAAKDGPRLPLFIERLKSQGVKMSFKANMDSVLKSVAYRFEEHRIEAADLGGFYDWQGLKYWHHIQFNFEHDLEELVKVTKMKVPPNILEKVRNKQSLRHETKREVAQQNTAANKPVTNQEQPAKKATSEASNRPAPSMWSRFKARFASSIEEILERVSLVIEKAKNKLKMRNVPDDTQHIRREHDPEPTQQTVPEPRPLGADLDEWSLGRSPTPDIFEGESAEIIQMFEDSRHEWFDEERGIDRSRNDISTSLSRLDEVRISPNPWDENHDLEHQDRGKGKHRPKPRGPSR